ncbi:hypothetical protein N8I77_007478 [Diaporthe amygdali]|uniref:Serine-rich protein n=1 Tax=Phomopsis amygdali TaxID=1214568 RepID=A0AAD9SD43_PHOAM|nr:hypothetical protein N8I77_007478 [Diaporthe amygdali]
MSAPDPDRPSLTPLRQQPSAIRVVPYSPPRAADSSEDHQPQSGASAELSDYGPDDDDDEDDYGSNWRRTNQTSEKTTTSGRPGQGPVALPSAPESRLLLARREDGVSGDKSATGAGTSGDGPRYHRPTTVAPAGPPPSNVASLAAINALHAPPTRGRLSASSYTTHTSLSSRHSASSHLSDAEPSSSSRASRSPSTGQRRPASSRRGGFVAVLNEDKTFSLVPQRPRPDPEPEPQPSLDPRSSSALSDYSGPGGGFRSPHLPFYPSTPRVSQASSHEGYTSYASSQYDRPSSAFTSTGTIPDRSITPSTPVPSSPGSSTVHEQFDDPIPETSSTPPTYRLVGGLRKVPKTPDLKWKQSDNSPSSDATETPLPVVPETSPSRVPGDDQSETHSIGAEQASINSNTPSGGSDPNVIVHEADSQAPSEAGLSDAAQEHEEGAPDNSQLGPDLREQASFDSQQTVSTEFESTNIKIYGHSGSEESEEALPRPSVEGAPSDVGSGQFVPPLQTQSSFQSVQSGVSTTSDNTNYRVYGPSSPGLPPVPEAETPQETNELRPAPSFLSAASTNSGAANWQVYGRTSPATLASVESFSPPSPSGSYAPLLRPSSPTAGHSFDEEEEEGGHSGNSDNETNYVVHGDPTPDPSPNRSPDASPPGTAVRPGRGGYSQESAAAGPSQLRRQPSSEGLGYYRSRSRSIENLESLRTKKSWRSVTSVSSIINEDAEDFFAGQAFLNEPTGQWEPPSVAGPSERQRQLDEQRERERQRAEEAASWAEEQEGQAPMALPTTPHQWSSQLSTVMSETEPGSSGGGTRSASLASGSQQGSHGRRSSRGWSSHSRQMLSISSSLAAELENASRSRSDSDPLERPSPVFNPRAGYHGTVRDHDEDGDGLADLQQITPRPSRQRLSDFFASSNSSERNLHSSHSSRSHTSSLNSNSIPAWARLYYGSGERKFLRNMSISSMSDLGTGSRPGSVQNSGSPTTDHFPLGIYSPRRRPHEARPDSATQRLSTAGSMDIEPAPAQEELGIRRGLRRITSSVWSPHLRRDVRARDRYSVWDPPSVSWSAESGMFGRRNVQVVLFVFGFIFPFAWMIGAVLPLPKPSPLAMLERYSSISDFGVRSREHEFERHIENVDELRYENAKWWRTLNRFMSVVGLLIIGAVVGLAVAAVKQGWGRT